MKQYPVAKPYITRREHQYVDEVLRSGHLSLGPKYLAFEKKFARHVGTRYACAVSSGTTGLHLALLAAGVKPDDEVITSPFSFIASANAIVYTGATPVFCDIEPVTYNLDPTKLERLITKKTKVILMVHIFGQSADIGPIMHLARKYRLTVIEDACESVDATYHGQKTGTFGQSAVFAFYPNKQMTTGEGGMIVTNNKRVYDLCCSLRNQGRGASMDWLDHQYIGYNYRLDEMSAAVGLAQLEKLDWMIGQRRKIAAAYGRYLKPYGRYVILPQTAEGRTHTWFVYVVRLAQRRVSRPRVIEVLRRHGIQTKVYLPSIHLFDVYRRRYHFRRGQYPVSESVSASALALPIYIGLRPTDIKFICRTLITILQKTQSSPV